MTQITITGQTQQVLVQEVTASIVEVVTPGSVIEVITPGIQGPPGSAAGAYVHTQVSAATTWTINHNIGYRPSVELLDAASREVDGDVYHPTVNQTVAIFNVAIAGTARLI
tara:strand:- start:297 stop:629 length:333 start_codon:yes stop_codon:yes gene_type:complete